MILLTRPRQASQELASRLDHLAVQIEISPVIDLVPLPAKIPETARALVLTSATAARTAAERAALADRSAYVVGQQAETIAKAAGAKVLCVAPTARDLAKAILADPPAGPLWYLCGKNIALDMPSILNTAGLETHILEIYDQPEQPLSGAARRLLQGDAAVILPLYSPRSAAILGRQAKEMGASAPLHLVGISDAALAQWEGPRPASCCRAQRPDGEAMIEAIESVAGRLA